MDSIETYIAPWALVGEEIPFYIKWEDFVPEKIEIELPNDFSFNMFSNVSQVEVISENKVVINQYFTNFLPDKIDFRSQAS